jgi:hypothetical protein
LNVWHVGVVVVLKAAWAEAARVLKCVAGSYFGRGSFGDIHAAVSDINPWLGIYWGGEAEGSNRRRGIGNAKKVRRARRKLHAANRP